MFRLLAARAPVLVSAVCAISTLLSACSDVTDGLTGADGGNPVAESTFKRGGLPGGGSNKTTVTSLTITPSSFTLAVGEQTTLTATPRNRMGQTVDGVIASWSSSDPTVASVSSGTVKGIKAGTALIVATANGVSDTATATISDAALPVASVVISPDTASLIVGQSLTLSATTLAADSTTLAGETVTWASSNPAVATVSSTGAITGVSTGSASVKATSGTASSTSSVTVTSAPVDPVASVAVTPTSASVTVGQTVQLSASTFDSAGAVLTGRSMTWTSSDATVATVSSTGLVTGVAAGSAVISATSEGKTGTSTVQVGASTVAVASVTMSKTSATLALGQSLQLTATAKDASGNVLTGRTTTWSSSNAAVATVSSSGLVLAVTAGSTSIKATIDGVSGTTAVTDTATTTSSGGTTTHAGYYVSPNGSSGGSGSITSPWDLASALSGNRGVVAGDTIWVRGGRYSGQFTNYLNGNTSQQIVVRQYPGERATIDGTILVMGSYVSFWGLEVMSSNPTSSSSIGVNLKAPGSRLINMVIHDAGVSGVGAWNEAPNAEVYGSIIYNNGTHANLDHGVYFNGSTGTKYITDNIVFDNWAFGLHAYSPTTGELNNLRIDGNTSFNNGSIGPYTHNPDLYVGGSSITNLTITNNNTWQWTDAELTLWLGAGSTSNQGLTLTNNRTVGGTSLGTWSSVTQSGNLYWSAASPPTSGLYVLVRPNRYEAGRANITVYNWSNLSSASADLSGVLRTGDTYEVRDAQNFFGAPVAQGTYGGGSISLPMTAITPPAPIGRSYSPLRSTGTTFHAFVVLKTN
ncbi:MAG: Ig-like domain-containing protein [Bacillota bacterium]